MRRSAVAIALVGALGAAVVSFDAAAAPSPPPPKLDGVGPPPAWVATARGDRWLAFSSYCWTAPAGSGGGARCADYIRPTCSAAGPAAGYVVPKIRVRLGEVVRFRLRFKPTQVRLEIAGRAARLSPSRSPRWRVNRRGVAVLYARASAGSDASYAACFVP